MARELHQDRLGTTDEKGKRIFLFPREVQGRFRNWRHVVYWTLIPIFLGLPWISINGEQSVLLDIPHRKFIFFGTVFLGHDTPLVFFALAIAAFAIAAVTAIFGRAWCGWACPQTVFIDAIYRKIEELVEGRARARKELELAPWSGGKIFKRALKWTLFTIISVHLAHTLIGYFVGIRGLFAITMSPPQENWAAFISMLVVSGILLFNFGWFREQFCIIACPYGRMQSVMMDSQALVIGYDYARGEPRRGDVPLQKDEGDCINCAKCVQVCPTGIDIRRGTQMECIACTACIDACDEIMVKVGKPKGLIRYTSEEILAGKSWRFIRARPIIYLAVMLVLTTAFIFVVASRSELSVVYVRGAESPYQLLKSSDGKEVVVNHLKAQLNYRPADSQLVHMDLQGAELVMAKNPFLVRPGKGSANFFVRAPRENFKNGKILVKIILKGHSGVLDTQEVTLVGP